MRKVIVTNNRTGETIVQLTDYGGNNIYGDIADEYIVKVDGKEILSLDEKEAAVQIMNDNLLEMENESAYEITKFLKDNDADLHSVFTKEDLNGYCIKIVITKNKDTGYDLGGCEINEKR